MRKIQLTRILEMADTLTEACGELERCSGGTFTGLCGQMQDFTSALYGCALEAGGEENALAPLLEAFYRLLYRAAQGETGTGELKALAGRIREEARAIRPDRIEAVFLCHKASMSDALESVYLAAKADPSCDAYFIPIPYYDRAPDGSLREEHLEGLGYYPDAYELTDWRAYDLAERRPDIVFTINPYDEQNRVTSVHPDFYCRRLRELTDLLVYIEYGIPYWIHRDPDAAIEELRKAPDPMPGHIYSHFCVAYSQEHAAVLRTVIRCKPELPRKHGVPPEEFQEKYLALGSPKFDKVLRSRREDFTLPEPWRRICRGRKVLLLNTSLSTLLKDTREYLRRLREALAVIRAAEGIALWWRPHPLSLPSLEAMEPELAAEYRAITEGFRQGGWGIYDESPDPHRAIAWTDAYYGDESSLAYLYCATGKPITICSSHHQNTWFSEADTFDRALEWRNWTMQAKGGNEPGANCCMAWWTFYDDLDGPKYLRMYLDFVLHPENYPAAEEHRNLQLRLFRDFVVNPDGTAGEKIYAFAKGRALAGEEDAP